MLARTLSVFLLLLLAQGLSAQNTAVVRFVESMAKKSSFINIVYDDGQREYIELEHWGGMMTSPGSLSEAMKHNQEVLAGVIGTLYTKGYELVEMSSTGESVMSTLLVFRRRQ
jgi:hypothetical protein